MFKCTWEIHIQISTIGTLLWHLELVPLTTTLMIRLRIFVFFYLRALYKFWLIGLIDYWYTCCDWHSCFVVAKQEDLTMRWTTLLRWVGSRMFRLSLHLVDVPSAVSVLSSSQSASLAYSVTKALRFVNAVWVLVPFNLNLFSKMRSCTFNLPLLKVAGWSSVHYWRTCSVHLCGIHKSVLPAAYLVSK